MILAKQALLNRPATVYSRNETECLFNQPRTQTSLKRLSRDAFTSCVIRRQQIAATLLFGGRDTVLLVDWKMGLEKTPEHQWLVTTTDGLMPDGLIFVIWATSDLYQ